MRAEVEQAEVLGFQPRGGCRARVLYADPPPPTLEIGTKVPDHRRQRRRKQIFPDVAKGKKLCFHSMCLYSIHSEFSGEINNGQKWVFFQSARNKYPTSEQSFSEMATTLVGGTLYRQTEGPWFNSQWKQKHTMDIKGGGVGAT